MQLTKVILSIALIFLIVAVCHGQSDIPKEKIGTLVRSAEEYDTWKWRFGFIAFLFSVFVPIMSILGFQNYFKAKIKEWAVDAIAKEAGSSVDALKSALQEFGVVAQLKKEKQILVVSAQKGQQRNVKKVFDGCRFERYDWKSVIELEGFDLKNIDLLLINDQTEKSLEIKEEDIRSILERYKNNVAYLYFGVKQIPVGKYRTDMPGIDIGLCNSSDRLETGIISILKII